MSRLSEMIKKLCPNGVEYKRLGEIGEFYSGLSGKTKDDFTGGNAKFITYMNVYSNPALKVDVDDRVKISEGEKQNLVEYGDVLFTGSSETPDECGMSSVLTVETAEPIYLNSFCFGYRLYDKKLFEPDFLKHLFRSHELRAQIKRTASGVTRFNVSKVKMAKVAIPLPPLEIQREIVQILDNFANLTAELTAELAKRKKQYEHYRDMLLNFTGGGRYDKFGVESCEFRVEWKRLGEIAEIGTGSSNTDEQLEKGAYPFFVRSQEVRWKNEFEYDETAIITSGDGVGVGKIFHFYEGKYALHQRAYRIHVVSDDFLPKYVFYYMKNGFLKYIEKNAFQSSVTSIRRPMLLNFQLPLVPLAEQKRIVAILDRFDSLCNSLSEGLPAEIELRKKQYEYYRDKLLSFKEAG